MAGKSSLQKKIAGRGKGQSSPTWGGAPSRVGESRAGSAPGMEEILAGRWRSSKRRCCSGPGLPCHRAEGRRVRAAGFAGPPGGARSRAAPWARMPSASWIHSSARKGARRAKNGEPCWSARCLGPTRHRCLEEHPCHPASYPRALAEHPHHTQVPCVHRRLGREPTPLLREERVESGMEGCAARRLESTLGEGGTNHPGGIGEGAP